MNKQIKHARFLGGCIEVVICLAAIIVFVTALVGVGMLIAKVVK